MIKLYDVGNRDIVELDTYANHVHAMTGEKLHSKSDIAAELAFRDARIAELEKERAVRDLEQQADELEKPHANTLKPFK